MNELQALIKFVKGSTKPVQEAVDEFFSYIVWSPLKDEFDRMNRRQKLAFFNNLKGERK
jgi:hypothetical protein